MDQAIYETAVLEAPHVKRKVHRRSSRLPKDFVIPPGYMTGDEFSRRVKEELTALYKEHGLI
jgi:hypothetical protein